MSWLRRRAPYERQRILEEASLARARGRRRKAIALYRWVLAVERNNAELHARLAPLLAETGQDFDAWTSYRTAAQAALREGREDRALAVYQEAAKLLPREIQAWQSIARLLEKRGDEAGAVECLLEGSRCFRSPVACPQAIHLLRRVRTIDPWHFESVLELASLLARAGQREEARLLLAGLASRHRGRRLRRVRGVQLRVEASPHAAWQWLATWRDRAAPGGDPDPAPLPAAERQVVPLRAARR